MRINFLQTFKLSTIAFGAAFFTSPALLKADTPANVTTESELTSEVTDKLRNLRTLLAEMKDDADHLESFTLDTKLSRQTHTYQLSAMREHVNAVGDELEELQALRPNAASWQQETIDRVVPAAVLLAARTTSAINFLSEKRQNLWAPGYVNDLRAIANLSNHIYGTINNNLKIADARENLQNHDNALAELTS
jgi:hypothetical protein